MRTLLGRFARWWKPQPRPTVRKSFARRSPIYVEELERRDVPSAIPLFEMTDPSIGPAIPVANDSAPNELGVKFTVFEAGTVTAIQFYRGAPGDPSNNAGFDVHLWDSAGNLLGSGHGDGNQAPGWQVVNLDEPVHLQQFQTYVASYFTPIGGYADTYNFFSGQDWNRGPVIANEDGLVGGGEAPPIQENNGVFSYGGGFPNQSYLGSNYWVGPIFTPDPDATNDPAPVVTGLSQTTAPTGGGGTLTIHGENLLLGVGHPLPTIYIGGQLATIPSGVLDPTAITVNIPAHLAGTVDVRVITDAGESDISAADQLTYVAPIVPANAIALFETGDPTFTPAIPVANDSNPVELGVKFSVSVPGTVTAIQFYRGEVNDSSYTVHLWDASGDLLGSGVVVEGQDSAPGWQTVELDQPIHLDAGAVYVASYYAPTGGYSADYNFFTGTSWDRGPLSGWPSNVQAGGNGVFAYGGGFPDQTYRDSNYWVGPVFTPDNANPPTVTSISATTSPTTGGTVLTIHGSNFASTALDIDFGDTKSLNWTLVDNNTLAALIPGHAAGTVDVRVITAGGESAVSAADQLTYVAPGVSPTAVSLFETTDPSFAPAIPVASETAPVELGVKFTVAVPGSVTAIQFYRGAPSGTGFTVHLWDAAGNLLGTGQAAGNQAAGWQTVLLDQPVALQPFATYIASYFAPQGGYADTYDYFTTNGISRGPLLAFSSAPGGEGTPTQGPNGLFAYGGGFPTQSFRDSNYWVSPVFEPASSVGAAPVITSLSMSSGSSAGGILLTINGANFTPDAISPSVYFGNTRANISIYSPNQIFVTVPPHLAGTVNVRVLTDAGESAIDPLDLFTYS